MASSPSNNTNEELMEVVVYTGGRWIQVREDDENERDSVYIEHNGDIIKEHRFKMPLNFTCALLHEHVANAIGIMNDYAMDNHFRAHVKQQMALGKLIEVYHTFRG
ncbi:hypothetical protein E3N88_08283 [Mikania micrantha]|uniref:Uncharacterized protein n=1 Tax=Mikania micrantha TaxID=192012 RepID=A0A5N6PGS6_9ASTR|nr:hypothetical protein E3N88_08283 [Mikania micrantha]